MTAFIFQLERIATPIGQMLVVTDDQGRLRAIDWADYETRMLQLMRQQYKGVSVTLLETQQESAATAPMRAYFDGNIAAIEGLEVVTGGTDFQRQVWAELCTIPHGQTISYGELAVRIGRPKAVRAVGLANGSNPISVVIPCHRVIGGSGVLTGYGGGLHRKQWLLEHEHALPLQRALTHTGQLPGF
ncbi:MAG: methylated-DNA--[protein]-cysteine S-methyltransferase [Burkholderiaceae bacterium]